MPTNRKLKVFISQPMHGRSKEEIETERAAAIDKFEEFAVANKWMTEADTIQDVNWMYDEPDTAPYPNRIRYLGRSIRKMSEADFVIFVAGWQESQGCKVEHSVAEQYYEYNVEMMKRRFPVMSDPDKYHSDGTFKSFSPLELIDEIWFGRNA